MSLNERILVTPRSLTAEPPPEVERPIVYPTADAMPAEQNLMDIVPDCIGWPAGAEPVTPKVIAVAGKPKVVSRNGMGIDNLPIATLRERGIRVMIAEGANSQGVGFTTESVDRAIRIAADKLNAVVSS